MLPPTLSLARRLLVATAAAAALALAATGCEGAGQGAFLHVFDPCAPLVVEAPGATDAERATLPLAIDMWRALGATGVTTDETAGAARLPVHFVDTEWFMGRYDDSAAAILIARRVPEGGPRAIVLAHEMGHAFGLYHVEDRTSVMNTGNWTVPPNDGDGEALAGLWGACGR